jgi:8-oxo-dGTP pyrophosphatase MutT (NUDIX family)
MAQEGRTDMKKGIDYIGNTVTFFCHDGKGNYLVSKRTDQCRDEHGTWDQGGGGIEFGDSAEDTIRAEVAQEYCTDVLDIEFLGYRDVFREKDGQPTHWIALDFKVLVDRNKAKNGEPHKFEEVRWCRIDEIPEPLHSQSAFTINKYRDRL